MNQRMPRLLGLVLLMICFRVEAQTAAFLYQGKLNEGGLPANGTYQFLFALADAAAQGNYVGKTLTNSGVTVTNGEFSATLDFGGEVFDGAARWLEVGVRTNGGAGSFVLLSPRQPILATPYAVHASTAGLAAGLVGGGALLTTLPAGNLVGVIPPGRLPPIGSNLVDGATDAAYRATDTNAILGFARTNLMGPVINVRDYGAKGDGRTDDTAAIAAAWEAWLARNGTLFFPNGWYLDSGTHYSTNYIANQPIYIDGRRIMGGGSAVWQYTGTGRHLYFFRSAPDLENLEFRNAGTATNCIYITQPQGSIAIRDCSWNGWRNATAGTLVLDECDKATLDRLYFLNCGLGLGLGYRCQNARVNAQTWHCGTGVAIGVPTERFPDLRATMGVDLDYISSYCDTALAVDAGSGSLTVHGYFWYATNTVVIGRIPGVSSTGIPSFHIRFRDTYYENQFSANSAVQLYGFASLSFQNCTFAISSATSPAIVKSRSPEGDYPRIMWENSGLRAGNTAAMTTFEDSAGKRSAHNERWQSRMMNQSLAIHNFHTMPYTQNGGSGYLFEVLDAGVPGPLLRVGTPRDMGAGFRELGSGLTADYRAARPSTGGTPGGMVFTLTNADLQVYQGALIVSTNAAPPESATPKAWWMILTPDGKQWKVGLCQ
jgi:hypothetical protein